MQTDPFLKRCFQHLLTKAVLLAGFLICLSFPKKTLSQTCRVASATLQHLTVICSRPKVGTPCLDSGATCTNWYLASTPNIFQYNYQDYDANDPGYWTQNITDGGTTTTTYPNILSSGLPDSYTVSYSDYSPFTGITYNPGSGTAVQYFPPDEYNETWTKNTTDGSWTYTDIGPGIAVTNSDSGYTLEGGGGGPFTTNIVDTCANQETTQSYSETSANDSGFEDIVYQATLVTIYTTAALEGHVDSIANSGFSVVTNWQSGTASSSHTLDGNEFNATASLSKYRFAISGTDPKRKYTLTWVETTVNQTGASATTGSSQIKSVDGIPGRAGIWYYPSESGVIVPTPSWPPGCNTGGNNSKSVSTPPTITVITLNPE